MLAMQARRRCVRFLTCRCACPQGADEVGKYANEECPSETQDFCALGGGTPKADACKAGTAAAKAWCGLLIGMNARSCSADADCPQDDEQREHAAEAAGITCTGSGHDASKCSDSSEDCCASDVWGEPQTCKDGYVARSTSAAECPSSWETCATKEGGIGCFGCYPSDSSVTVQKPPECLATLGKMVCCSSFEAWGKSMCDGADSTTLITGLKNSIPPLCEDTAACTAALADASVPRAGT